MWVYLSFNAKFELITGDLHGAYLTAIWSYCNLDEGIMRRTEATPLRPLALSWSNATCHPSWELDVCNVLAALITFIRLFISSDCSSRMTRPLNVMIPSFQVSASISADVCWTTVRSNNIVASHSNCCVPGESSTMIKISAGWSVVWAMPMDSTDATLSNVSHICTTKSR